MVSKLCFSNAQLIQEFANECESELLKNIGEFDYPDKLRLKGTKWEKYVPD